jgi:hypothetical protein
LIVNICPFLFLIFTNKFFDFGVTLETILVSWKLV